MIRRINPVLRFLFSGVLALAICWLFIPGELKYTEDILSSKPFDYERQHYYFDLNQDGTSEKVLCYTTVNDLVSLIFYEEDGDVIVQYNVPGDIVVRSQLFEADYDSNGLSEVYMFAYLGDSLFLNVIDPYKSGNGILARKHIPGTRLLNGEPDYVISGAAMDDFDGDGYKDLYFSINAGFTLQPRQMFCYSTRKNTLWNSPASGSGPRYSFAAEDIDQDGHLEFWGQNTAYDNFGDSLINYSDNSAWFMVYSHKLEFEFEPVEFRGFRSMVDAGILNENDSLKLIVISANHSSNDSAQNRIHKYTSEGLLEKSRILDFNIGKNRPNFFIHESLIYINDYQGTLYCLDADLGSVTTKKFHWMEKGIYVGKISINQGEEVLVFQMDNRKLVLVNEEFKQVADIQLNEPAGSFRNVTFVHNQSLPAGIQFKSYTEDILIAMSLNPRRFNIYLYWLLITLVIYGFISFTLLFQKRRDRIKQETENKFRTLQMQTLKSQMNPHFIFNALNSVSSMYTLGDQKRAEGFLISFSRMIREVVDSADRVIVSLEEEFSFIQNYLELEKIRYGDPFKFVLELPEDCKNAEIPSMVVHNFVENSVKHGFPDKTREMKVEVEAMRSDGKVTVLVKDNGVGRDKASGSGRKGRGIQMVKEILDSYSRIRNKKAMFEINPDDLVKSDSNGFVVRIIFNI